MGESNGVRILRSFLLRPRTPEASRWTAVSLFSGAGLSDLGYKLARFRFAVQVEIDPLRARLGQENFRHSNWIVGDVRRLRSRIVAAYKSSRRRPLDLLIATPPCQGMSPSNPGRGNRDESTHWLNEEKNKLILEVIPVANELKPRVVVAENVRPILTLSVSHRGRERPVLDILGEGLPDYEVFDGVVDVADYGVPQVRRRAIIVAVRRDEPWLAEVLRRGLLPWPRPTHAEDPSHDQRPWITVREWIEGIGYERLDARDSKSSTGRHPLHFVPHYETQPDRYLQVSQIPHYNGRSAYSNSKCPSCGARKVPEGRVTCSRCGALMRNRPYVLGKKGPRLIKGFGRSSYRRMAADRPAPTVTTNSNRVGSDRKIHPWENRVLSILEVADLQTVPRFYRWPEDVRSQHTDLIRAVIGEAFPPYFTYLHGRLLARLLAGDEVQWHEFAVRRAGVVAIDSRRLRSPCENLSVAR